MDLFTACLVITSSRQLLNESIIRSFLTKFNVKRNIHLRAPSKIHPVCPSVGCGTLIISGCLRGSTLRICTLGVSSVARIFGRYAVAMITLHLDMLTVHSDAIPVVQLK